MKKLLYSILILMIFLLNSSLVFAATNTYNDGTANVVNSDVGVVVPVRILPYPKSDKFYSEDIVYFVVQKDILVDNKICFKKDSKGYALTNVELHTTTYGQTGLLKIQEAKMNDVNGVSHHVQLNTVVQGKTKRVSAIAIAGMDLVFNYTPLGNWKGLDAAVISPNRVVNAVILD